jgi:hypothetical protein
MPSKQLETCWLSTPAAALSLGLSPSTLKRYADRDQILIEGSHWRSGLYRNSPRVWDVESCRMVLTHHGMIRRSEAAQGVLR